MTKPSIRRSKPFLARIYSNLSHSVFVLLVCRHHTVACPSSMLPRLYVNCGLRAHFTCKLIFKTIFGIQHRYVIYWPTLCLGWWMQIRRWSVRVIAWNSGKWRNPNCVNLSSSALLTLCASAFTWLTYALKCLFSLVTSEGALAKALQFRSSCVRSQLMEIGNRPGNFIWPRGKLNER